MKKSIRGRFMTRILLVACVACIASNFTGCGSGNDDALYQESKDYLVSRIRELETQADTDFERIEELENMLKGVQGEIVETASIRQFSDGTGRLTLSKDMNSKMIKFPDPLEYPGSIQSPNTSGILVAEGISIKPSSNWTVCIDGTDIELEHENGIWGKIKIGGFDAETRWDRVMADGLLDYMNEFYSALPPSEVTYKRIYLDDNWVGLDSTELTSIEERDAVLRCGLLCFGDYPISYVFCYNGNSDSSKNELILTLLQTFTVFNMPMRVE